MIAVYRATNKDREPIMGMLKHFHTAAGYDWPYDAPRVNRAIEYMVNNTNCILLVASIDSKVVGCLGATNEESLFAPLKASYERFLWVNVGSRGKGSIYKVLIESWLAWARAEKCTDALLTSQAHMRAEAVGRLYRRFGFTLTELVYSRTL